MPNIVTKNKKALIRYTILSGQSRDHVHINAKCTQKIILIYAYI